MGAPGRPVERVGLVLSGAAARGPYQAGALAELIPALIAENRWPVIILGTSSGALNAALLAQYAADGAQAGERVVQTWLDVGSPFRNAWLTTPCKAFQLGLRAVGLSVVPPVTSLLDTQPLRDYAEQTFDPAALTNNVRPGLVETIGVAATWCPPAQAAGRTRRGEYVAVREPGLRRPGRSAMWHSIMTLPDGAEISVHVPSSDDGGVTYRVSRHGKKIGDFTELHDIALFVRYRHDQATHDAFITAAQQQVSTSQRSTQVPARTR